MEEEIELPSTKSIGVKFGAISGLIGIIYFTVVDLAGLSTDQSMQWIGTVISIAITVVILHLAYKEFKTDGDNFMEFGEGVRIGSWIAFIGSLIASAYVLLYTTVINSGYIDAIREKSITDMEDQGLSDSEIDQAMPFVEMFTGPIAISLISLFFGFLTTFVVALIFSAIVKKPRPELT